MQLLLLLTLGLFGVDAVPLQDVITPRAGETCGYESCPKPKPGFINVHIVPHTHDDVGWLKTVDQYYYGSRNNIQKAGVQYILNSVVKELWEDPKRRFMYVETAFFWKWWVRQSKDVQSKVHTLVRQGRLQFVGGAWSMNDEAAAHYQSIIDQFTWGLSKLNETFGHCGLPRIGWQIDPFGHSREFASLLAMMGYDGLFLGRIDYQDKLTRLNGRSMEMVWRGDDDLGKSSDIFTGVLRNNYSPPPGFCFDVLCNDEPIIDDPDSPINNVEEKINQFMGLCADYSKSYKSNNVLITMGEDFNYQDATMWFSNLDKLIQYSYVLTMALASSARISRLLDMGLYQFRHNWCGSILRFMPTITAKKNGFSGLVQTFINYVSDQAKYYRSDNVILTMGGDFTYQDATMWYSNLDKLITYTNLMAAKNVLNITAFYSTPDCYLKAIRDSSPAVVLPTKDDDFFPYASDPHAYWTGYFTSRPTTKFFERQSNNVLQMVKQLQVLANLNEHNIFVLNELKSAMGVMQHHDAITGTEKQHVTHDYERLLSSAVTDALIIAKEAFNKLTQKDPSVPPLLEFSTCHLNESSCYISENKERFIVTLYNPLGWAVKEPVRIPVVDGQYDVWGPDAKVVKSQLVSIAPEVIAIPTRHSKATQEIVFIAELKPLAYKSFYVTKNKRAKRNTNNFEYYTNMDVYFEDVEYKSANVDILKDGTNDAKLRDLEKFLKEDEKVEVPSRQSRDGLKVNYPNLNMEEMRMLADEPRTVERFDDEVILDNKIYKVKVDTATGEINGITFPTGSVNLTVKMYYYPGASGRNTEPGDRASGAYIFRPSVTTPTALVPIKKRVVVNDIVKEFRVNFYPAGYMNIKIYNDLPFVENEFIVGPIPIDDQIGKEYIIKYGTGMINNGEFYTDSNGRQTLKRKLNYRPQYNVTLEEPVAGNYYPINNEINIRDDNLKMTVLTDRSEGGSSLVEGEIELMVHRRLLWDDAFGVGEPLNETAKGKGLVVRGKHRLLFTKIHDNVQQSVLGMHLTPHVLFSDATNVKFVDWVGLNNEFSFVNSELPNGVHLLTLEPWGEKLLIRLENYLNKGQNSDVNVDLTTLFKNISIKNIRESMLSANIWADEYKKFMWNGDVLEDVKRGDGLNVQLKAKEIRTFIAEYEIKK